MKPTIRNYPIAQVSETAAPEQVKYSVAIFKLKGMMEVCSQPAVVYPPLRNQVLLELSIIRIFSVTVNTILFLRHRLNMWYHY